MKQLVLLLLCVPLFGVSQSILNFDDSLNSEEKRFLEEVRVFLPKNYSVGGLKEFNKGKR